MKNFFCTSRFHGKTCIFLKPRYNNNNISADFAFWFVKKQNIFARYKKTKLGAVLETKYPALVMSDGYFDPCEGTLDVN